MGNTTASARFEIYPAGDMPDGYLLVQVEVDTTTVLAVRDFRDGGMRPELCEALNRSLARQMWSVDARFEIRPEHRMPRGQILTQYTTPDGPLLAVRTGYMTPRLEQALNRHLARCEWAAGASPAPRPATAIHRS